ncbi:MAG: SIR2 family protein [Pleomorphochaeta sp.]
MAKRGFTIRTLTPLIKEACMHQGWSLCIGAGTSMGLFPSWNQLVLDLINLDLKDEKASKELATTLLNLYSPDSIIEAAFNKNSLSTEDLSNTLYNNIRTVTTNEEWNTIKKIFLNSNPGDHTDNIWDSFEKIINEKTPNLTALILSDIVTDLIGSDIAPKSILSFNAEPLFFTLLNLYSRKKLNNSKKYFDSIIGNISSISNKRIPYIFCHGLLPIPGSKRKNSFFPGKLVFSETEYLKLANTSYSWQSTQFLHACSSHHIIFIGLSLSDSNIRRWLTWVHDNRIKEISELTSDKKESTVHYWININPENTNEKRWIENIVSHLGIRLIWIDKWEECREVFKILLNID